jgi:hypothetical protein
MRTLRVVQACGRNATLSKRCWNTTQGARAGPPRQCQRRPTCLEREERERERERGESCITSTCLSSFHQPHALTERYDEICFAHSWCIAVPSTIMHLPCDISYSSLSAMLPEAATDTTRTGLLHLKNQKQENRWITLTQLSLLLYAIILKLSKTNEAVFIKNVLSLRCACDYYIMI